MRKRYLIHGMVQGVGFRCFTRRTAARLGLIGWVRNLPGGHVEAEAQGSGPDLASFEAELARGPLGAQVTRVVGVEISDEINAPKAFEVR